MVGAVFANQAIHMHN